MPFEARCYGPYNRLLNYAMVEDTLAFFPAPQIPLKKKGSVRFFIFLVGFNQQRNPVLFTVIKDGGCATAPTSDMRRRADNMMGQMYEDMLYDCPIPHCMGTSICTNCCDKDTRVTPPGCM